MRNEPDFEDFVNDEASNLLIKYKYYLSNNIYEGYKINLSDIKDIKLVDDSVLKFKYRTFSDKDYIIKFIFWLKFLPYEGHTEILINFLEKIFNNNSDHFNRIIDYESIIKLIKVPIERLLFFKFEEWIVEFYFGNIYNSSHEILFGSIVYDILKFVVFNKDFF